MNKTIVAILVVALGIYCFPALIGMVAAAFGIAVGVLATLFSIGVSLLFTVLPYIILGYLIWWLVRDNRRSRHS